MGQVQAGAPYSCVLHGGDVCKQCSGVNKEVQEVFVIAKTDTAHHPRAVVVHPQEARVAQAAVVRTLRLCFVALAAPHGATAAVERQD